MKLAIDMLVDATINGLVIPCRVIAMDSDPACAVQVVEVHNPDSGWMVMRGDLVASAVKYHYVMLSKNDVKLGRKPFVSMALYNSPEEAIGFAKTFFEPEGIVYIKACKEADISQYM